MARRVNLARELVDMAETVVRETSDAHELRTAQTILLPALLGIDLIATGRLIGRSRASVSRLQAEFRASVGGETSPRTRWGGRRRQNLTAEEEQAFLAPFLETAREGGVLVVSEIHKAYEGAVGKTVPPSTVYRLLARHGWRKVAPARRHPKGDPEARQVWKKNSNKT